MSRFIGASDCCGSDSAGQLTSRERQQPAFRKIARPKAWNAAIAAGRVLQSFRGFLPKAVTQTQSSLFPPLTAFR